jgi:hypothetical protein
MLSKQFYFSDSNSRKDTFLRAASETDPEGLVPIATLLIFNKLKALTSDAAIVASAAKESEVVAVRSCLYFARAHVECLHVNLISYFLRMLLLSAYVLCICLRLLLLHAYV